MALLTSCCIVLLQLKIVAYVFRNLVQAAEIINIVSQFKANKSAGVDNIGPKLLKVVLYDIIQPLVHTCNLSFETGVSP